jgi:hypothetical protein
MVVGTDLKHESPTQMQNYSLVGFKQQISYLGEWPQERLVWAKSLSFV